MNIKEKVEFHEKDKLMYYVGRKVVPNNHYGNEMYNSMHLTRGREYEIHVRMYRIFYVIEEEKVKILILDIEHKDETDKYLRQLTKEKIKDKLSGL